MTPSRDVDELKDLEYLPTEIKIPDTITNTDEISDYLSDTTGFCVKNYKLEPEKEV